MLKPSPNGTEKGYIKYQHRMKCEPLTLMLKIRLKC